MKSSALQQEIYEYKNSQLQLNKDFYTSKIDEESKKFDEKREEFVQSLDLKLKKQTEEYKKLKENNYKKTINNTRLSKIHKEKEQLALDLLDEFESYIDDIIENVVEQSLIILKCSEKDLELKVSNYLKEKINSSKLKFSFEVDNTLSKHEFVCKYGHNLVRFNLKNEINSIIQREVDTK